MVTLINIKKTNEYIEANYIPEDTSEEGYIKMRLSDLEIVERTLTPSDGTIMKSYFVHARNGLLQILEEGASPSKWAVMWYQPYDEIYTVLSVEKEWFRVIDNSGEDYLYPPEGFEIVD